MPRDSESEDTSDSTDSGLIGPGLPTEMQVRKHLEPNVMIGPVLPHKSQSECSSGGIFLDEHKGIGPQLPSDITSSSPTLEQSQFGPQLPPHLQKSASSKNTSTIGPVLPPHLRKQLEEEADRLFKEIDEPDDCESYGPLPVGASGSDAHVALEERALQMRIDKLKPDSNEPIREAWMTELPEAKAPDFGLGPRQFRKQAGPDMSDRSLWTNVPSEKGKQKEKKVDLKADAEFRELQKKDQEYDMVSRKHKRKSKSLVEIHQEKVQKKDEESSERRPFNRETDLQVNKFDDAQKKSILKKAQLLDDRFSSGKSKYL